MARKRSSNALVLSSSKEGFTDWEVFKILADVLCIVSLLLAFSCTALYRVYVIQLKLTTTSYFKSVILLFAIGNVALALVLLLEVAHRSFVISTEVIYLQILPSELGGTDKKTVGRGVPSIDDFKLGDGIDFWNAFGWIPHASS
ncbi:hypothetical protein RQP46_002554 [Phenoliferia psychrophenolica]